MKIRILFADYTDKGKAVPVEMQELYDGSPAEPWKQLPDGQLVKTREVDIVLDDDDIEKLFLSIKIEVKSCVGR